MAGLFRPRNVIIAGAAGVGLYAFSKTSSRGHPDINPFETQGAKNIGNRWSGGGGSNTHTPGVATQRGNMDQTVTTQENPKGVDSPHFQNTQSEQKPGQPSMVDAKYRQAAYGSQGEKGK